MQNLSNCLQSQINVVGSDCQNIGKSVGSGLFAKKVMLSYDLDEGWKCVKMNLVQLFLRKAFGFYQSTHLDTVARGLNRTLDKNRVSYVKVNGNSEKLISKFESRIHDLWAKSHKKTFPKSAYVEDWETSSEILRFGKHLVNKHKSLTSIIGNDDQIPKENLTTFEKKVLESVDDIKELGHYCNYPDDKIVKIQKGILKKLEQVRRNEMKPAVFLQMILEIQKKMLEISMNKQKPT